MSELIHYDVDSESECFGEMQIENIFKKGILVDRVHYCLDCGYSIMEEELLKVEKECGLIIA